VGYRRLLTLLNTETRRREAYRSLPELAGLPIPDRDRVWAASLRRARRRPSYWLSFAAFLFFGGVFPLFVIPNLWPAAAAPVLARLRWIAGQLPFPLYEVAFIVLPPILAVLLTRRFDRWLTRRYVPHYLPGHCNACGYDLRGTPGRCPECGTVPRAAVADPDGPSPTQRGGRSR
jgi:hypothetical protein